MKNPEFFVPKNAIETAQELQWTIQMEHPEVAQQKAKDSLTLLGDIRKIYGGSRLIIHTWSAYSLDRGLTMDERIQELTFNEMTIIGFFGGIKYAEKLGTLRLQTLFVDMYDVRIIDPVPAYTVGNGRLTPPLMIPVLDIQTVLAAA